MLVKNDKKREYCNHTKWTNAIIHMKCGIKIYLSKELTHVAHSIGFHKCVFQSMCIIKMQYPLELNYVNAYKHTHTHLFFVNKWWME